MFKGKEKEDKDKKARDDRAKETARADSSKGAKEKSEPTRDPAGAAKAAPKGTPEKSGSRVR